MSKDIGIDIVPGTQYKIIQDKRSFSYGTDAIFLSSFTNPKGLIMDLGTGTGIIPLRLAWRKKHKKIYGAEIQESVANLAKETIKLNNLQEEINILNIDLKELPSIFGKHTFDVVTSNPPYMKEGSALVNKDVNFTLSRHEVACTIEDIIKVTDYLLKPLGKFYLVHRPDRLVDIFHYMRQYNIEPKYIKFVQPRKDKKPNLILIEGIKHGKPDLKFYDPLIVYNEDETYTDEIYEIYGMDR